MKLTARSFISILCSLMLISFLSSEATAENIGVVNVNKIFSNYSSAQEVTANMQVKEKKLKEFIEDAQNQINTAKTPLEKKNIEEKLGQQYKLKIEAFEKERLEKISQLDKEIVEAIEAYAKQKKLDMVLNDQMVIVGGIDITDEIIKILNK